MIDVPTAHTSSLDAATLREIRAFLEDASDGAFDEHDWDHALGASTRSRTRKERSSRTLPSCSGGCSTPAARSARATSRASRSAPTAAGGATAGW